MPRRPMLSVIVPAFNVESTLEQALDSLISQTFGDWEAICVDDASTDSTGDILRAYAAEDERIQVLCHEENAGYGKSMNDGIGVAAGEWLGILEPDDYLLQDFLCELMNAAIQYPEAQVIKSPYIREIRKDGVARGGKPRALWQCSYKGRVRPASQPFSLRDEGTVHLLLHHPSIWSAVYSREFLQKRDVSFPEYPGAGWADNEFFYKAMLSAERIVYVDSPGYIYREETPAEYGRLAESNMKMFFERWHSMQDIVEALEWQGTAIAAGHAERGFTYLAGLEPFHAGRAEYEALKTAMFSRMDPRQVLKSASVPTGLKRQFADFIGTDELVDDKAYKGFLLEETAYAIGNNGLGYAIESAKKIITRK